MNATPSAEDILFERIAADLASRGYALVDDAALTAMAEALHARVTALRESDFSPAGIGRAQDQAQNEAVRRDEIRWLTADNDAERAWLDWIERLRLYMNRRLYLGLFSYEGHFAHYRPGDYYRLHLDAFRGKSNRVLTTVFYLNPEWRTEDGGEMILYPEHGSPPLGTTGQGTPPLARIMPTLGRLAVFLSEEFPHEVLPARRDRYSIAGWYRVNASTADRPDPPT